MSRRRRSLVVAATLAAVLSLAVPALAYWAAPGSTSVSAGAGSLLAVSGATGTAVDATHAAVSWSLPAGQLPGATYDVTSGDTTYCAAVAGNSCQASGLSAATSYAFSITPRLGAWRGPAVSAPVTTPSVGLVLSAASVTAVPATLAGTATAFPTGDTVTWRLDSPTGSLLTGTSVIPANGAVSVTLPAGTSGGSHVIYLVDGALVASATVSYLPAAPTAVTLANGGGTGSAYVNAANRSSVSVAVTLPAGTLATDQVRLTVTDGTTTVTPTALPGTSGAGTKTFTGLNLAGLADGSLVVTAWVTRGSVSSANLTVLVTKDVVAPAVTALASANGDGKLATGDSLTVTFSEAIAASSFSGAQTVKESRTGNGNVTLSVSDLTTNANTGSSAYLGGNGSKSATFNATISVSGTTVVVTVGTVQPSQDATAAGSGALTFAPTGNVVDAAGNPATATFVTGSTFKLF